MINIDFEKLEAPIQEGSEAANSIFGYSQSSMQNKTAWQPPKLYKTMSSVRSGAMAQMVTGGIFAVPGIFLTSFGAIPALLNGSVSGYLTRIIFGTIFILLGAGLALFGLNKLARRRRFLNYQQALDGKTYAELSQFSTRVGKSISFLEDDLQKMIEDKWFLQGHLDRQNDMLITSDKTYANYKLLLEKQKDDIKKAEKEDAALQRLTPEERHILTECKESAERIERTGKELPSGMKMRVDHLAPLIKQIVEEGKKHPSRIQDLRKLMNYYLPTTEKLLSEYIRLEKEAIATQNVAETKSKIQTAIDEINDAFEKLYTDLFRDTEWDVESDISVLGTMLSKEGLASDSPFATSGNVSEQPAAPEPEGIQLKF